MPDHWGFVFAAYGIVAVVLFGYWRRLIRHHAELSALKARREAKRP